MERGLIGASSWEPASANVSFASPPSALRRHDYCTVLQKVASKIIADAVVAVVQRAAVKYSVQKHVNGNQERGRKRREGGKGNAFGGPRSDPCE